MPVYEFLVRSNSGGTPLTRFVPDLSGTLLGLSGWGGGSSAARGSNAVFALGGSAACGSCLAGPEVGVGADPTPGGPGFTLEPLELAAFLGGGTFQGASCGSTGGLGFCFGCVGGGFSSPEALGGSGLIGKPPADIG